MKRPMLTLIAVFVLVCSVPPPSEVEAIRAQFYYSRGVSWYEKGEYDKAISDFTKAIELNPRYSDAYINRGVVYGKKGQFDHGIADCSRAIELNPKGGSAYFNRGVSYYNKGEYNKAWDDVYKAQNLGHQVHPGFLKALREASGRQK